MHVRIHSALTTISLVPWYEADLDLVGRSTLGLAELRSLLASEPGLASSLRRLLVEVDAHALGTQWCSDEQLAQQVVRLIERGLLRVQVESRPLVYTPPVEDSAVPEHVVEPLAPVDDTPHWIEVQLLGEDDEAISGARCQIILPNGKTLVRTTDRFGLVRVDGVEHAGDCEISFPDLDKEAWGPL